MASGKITNKPMLSGTISSGNKLKSAAISGGGGTTDHSRLINRANEDQHPIEAITDLRKELDSKLNSETALPLIQEALQTKAKGLYFDVKKELARKSCWYLTSEIDPKTGLGTKESIISGPYDLGMGGGSGGGGGVTTVSVKQVNWPTTVVIGKKLDLAVEWSSVKGEEKEPTGNGTLYLSIDGKQAAIKSKQQQGTVIFENVELPVGQHTIEVEVMDAYGSTMPVVSTIVAVELLIADEDVFNDGTAWPGEVAYKYKAFGNFSKFVYFIIDGNSEQPYAIQEVTSSGDLRELTIKGLGHGSHTLEVYFTTELNGERVFSNTLYHELIVYKENNTTPIITSSFAKESIQEQYIAFNIPYYVYSTALQRPRVYYYLESEGVRTELSTFAGGILADRTLQKLPYRFDNYYLDEDAKNNYSLIIKCGETEKKFNITVAKSSINVTPVTTALALHLDAQGRSNTEANRDCWIDKASKVSCELTGFNWSSNGWKDDPVTKETFLRLNAGAKAMVPYKVLSGTPQLGGKTIELDFAARDIRDYEAPILTCRNAATRKFYEVSTTFVDDDIRAKNFTVTLNQDLFTSIYPNAGTYIFEYTNEDTWRLIGGELADLSACGITLTEHLEDEEGEYIDSWKLVGDLIVVSVVEDAIGFYVTPQKVAIRSLQSKLSVQFKEDEHVRISIVIEDASVMSPTHILWIYVNGIASCAIQYPLQGENFAHENFMYLGADNGVATLDIYNIRVYNQALTSKQVVENWIADTQNPALKASRYAKNNIYDAWSGKITPESIEALGNLPYIIWDIDTLPQFKGNKRLGNVVYKDPLGKDRSFKSGDATYNVQGTSSAGYPVKNIRIKYKQAKAEDFPTCDFWWENGYENEDGETIKKFPITVGGIGDNYFTYKVDYASSEGANNVELTKLYNDLSKELGILTPPQRKNSQVRVGIDGFPIVAFHETADGARAFWTKANFNNDKDNEDVYGFADGDESWEITNNSFRTTKFKAGVNITDKTSSDYYSKAFEARFPEDNSDLSRLKAMTDWVASTDPEQATDLPLSELLGRASVTFEYKDKELGEDNSYKDVEKSETFDTDSREYRITKFKAELKDWFDVDSTLFYYLYTELFLMIDSRAKNAFPTYFKSRQEGDGGDRWFWIPYDMDTALGINNMGELVFDYSLEDYGEYGKYAGGKVYNGQESVMWNNVREGFYGQLAAMYAKMRGSLLNFAEIDGRFEEHQNKWPEAIFNEDAIIKYVNPLRSKAEGGLGENYLSMLQGSKAQQRKWWLYNRLRYIDSKYNAADAKSDYIQFRAYAGGAGTAKPSISVIPYTDIYAAVSYSNGELKTARAPRNIITTVPTSFTAEDDSNEQETYIYSASQLKDIGDLAPFYAKTVKVAAATKLQKLKVGDDGTKYPGYKNENLRQLELGENTLLKVLDVRNCVNLGKNDEQNATPTVDVSKCTNIEEIYFTGTQITGIQLPDGGTIKKLYLPGTMQALVIRNQPVIETLQIDTMTDASTGRQYSEIENLWLENIPFNKISAKNLLELMLNKPIGLIGASYSEDFGKYQRGVCLKGVNEHFENAEDLLAFTGLLDSFFGVKLINELLVVDLTSKAIISGNITISGSIAYSTLAELCDWDDAEQAWRLKEYKDLLIKAPNTICSVIFDPANGDSIRNWNVSQGTSMTAIDAPNKPKTIDKVFTFSHWEDSFGKSFEDEFTAFITADTVFTAKYTDTVRQYTVEFNANSNLISVSPASVQVSYGTEIPVPSTEGVPQDVGLNGWFLSTSIYPWDFAKVINENNIPNLGVDDTIRLTAQWNDATKPVIGLSIVNPLTVKFEATDNLGLIAWGITIDAEETSPEQWEYFEASTSYSKKYVVSSEGLHTFWVKDGVGQIAKTSINVYSVIVTALVPEGIDNYYFYDQTDPQFIIPGFAIENTSIRIAVKLDSHYKDLTLKLNNNYIAINKSITVNQDIEVFLDCKKQQYEVNFDLDGKGEPIPAQLITYQEKIIQPDNQYYSATKQVIQSWYRNKVTLENGQYEYRDEWHFDRDTVSDNLTLHAYWVDYSEPSKITLFIPEETEPDENGKYPVTVSYVDAPLGTNLLETDLVRVDFGDGVLRSSRDVNAELPVGLHVPMVFYYDSPGTKTIKIYGNNKGYSLGYSSTYPLILPAKYLTAVKLAWDVATLTPYIFQGSKLINAPLTDYIVNISDGAFKDCQELTTVELPRSLQIIGQGSFQNCSKLAGILRIPSKVVTIGKNAFNSCSTLLGVDFTNAQSLIAIEDSAFGVCSKIESIDIPVSVTRLGTGCFAACRNLTKVILRNPNLTIGESGAFYNCFELKSAGPIGSYTKSDDLVDIEYAWRQTIPAYAFSQIELTEIILPSGLETIGKNAFQSTQISTIELPPTLATIEDKAFAFSTLQKITIPNGVKNIGIGVFSYCRSLSDIQLYITGVSADTKEKQKEPTNSWFYLSNPDAVITAPYSIFDEELGIIPSDVFGSYWNLYDTKSGEDGGYLMIAYIKRAV